VHVLVLMLMISKLGLFYLNYYYQKVNKKLLYRNYYSCYDVIVETSLRMEHQENYYSAYLIR